jgi:hypothetical protein
MAGWKEWQFRTSLGYIIHWQLLHRFVCLVLTAGYTLVACLAAALLALTKGQVPTGSGEDIGKFEYEFRVVFP